MNATEIEKLKQLLLAHEGLRLKPYFDSVNKLTIGVGRNLDDVGISTVEAMFLLDSDIERAQMHLDNALPWWRTLSPERQIVLADMCFNMGIGRLLGFARFLSCLKESRFGEAAVEMLDSKWAEQTGKRAKELAQMMRTETA